MSTARAYLSLGQLYWRVRVLFSRRCRYRHSTSTMHFLYAAAAPQRVTFSSTSVSPWTLHGQCRTLGCFNPLWGLFKVHFHRTLRAALGAENHAYDDKNQYGVFKSAQIWVYTCTNQFRTARFVDSCMQPKKPRPRWNILSATDFHLAFLVKISK